MKVLFVQNIEGIAGSEKYFLQLLPSLKQRGVSVEFLAVHKHDYISISQEFCNQLNEKDIVTHSIACKGYLSFGLLKKIKNLITENKYDIVHSHLIYADFWSVMIKKLFRLKFVSITTLHGYQEKIYTEFCLTPEKIPHNKYYRIAKFVYKRLDYAYACSEGLKDFYIRSGIKFKHPVHVIHHGFDYPIITTTEQKNESDFLCVIPGRLIPRKGHQLVLNQCEFIKSKIQNFKIMIVGGGELKNDLANFVHKNNLTEIVTFTGNVPDVRPYLIQADLIVIPSYSEGLPLVIFEAMSVAKPVIAFDTIGPAEVVQTNKTGYLIKPFDEKLFAEKIVQLANDKNLLIEMGKNAQTVLNENFTLKRMTDKTIAFYQTVL